MRNRSPSQKRGESNYPAGSIALITRLSHIIIALSTQWLVFCKSTGFANTTTTQAPHAGFKKQARNQQKQQTLFVPKKSTQERLAQRIIDPTEACLHSSWKE